MRDLPYLHGNVVENTCGVLQSIRGIGQVPIELAALEDLDDVKQRFGLRAPDPLIERRKVLRALGADVRRVWSAP